MNYQQEHDEFTYATASDWDRADALQLGEEQPGQAWVLTDRDVWHANPYYTGPALPHPEDEYAQAEYYVVGQHAVNLYEEHLARLDIEDQINVAEYGYNDDADFPF